MFWPMTYTGIWWQQTSTPGFLDIISFAFDVGMLCVGHDQNAELIGKHIRLWTT